MDFILNGQATGDVASVLMANNFDVGALRPWKGRDGRSYVTLVQRNQDGSPKLHTGDTISELAKKRGMTLNSEQVERLIGTSMTHNVLTNATATLRKDDWLMLDRAVMQSAKPRFRAFADLRSRNSFNIPNGMGKTILEWERTGDISPATVSMDGIREGDSDRPIFDLQGLPLPITHKDFHFSARQVMVSRNGGSPLDTTNAGLAARRVAEEIEKQTIGISDALTKYAGYEVYGYTNFPQRITHAITSPETVGWTPRDLVQELLAMKAASQAAYHWGPWTLYTGPDWDPYLDDDYQDTKGDTLRQRIGRIQGFDEPITLDYLSGYDVLLVQQTEDVARAVVGMDITTLQWETKGGMMLNFKVMCILVPQLRSDINGNTGIVHGVAA